MKPLDKKDMPKLIALIGLTVCSLGYGVYTLTAGSSYAKPAPASGKPEEKKDEPKTVGGVPDQPAGTDNPMMSALKTLEQVSDPVIVRDPFVTRYVPGADSSAAPSARPPMLPPAGALGLQNSKPVVSLADRLGLIPKLKKDSAPSVINDISADPTGSRAGLLDPNKAVVLPPPDHPTVQVSGVMVAENTDGKSVALLRIESQSRWVSIGDSIGKGFIVHSIRRTDRGSEVEIIDSQNAKRRYTFKVN